MGVLQRALARAALAALRLPAVPYRSPTDADAAGYARLTREWEAGRRAAEPPPGELLPYLRWLVLNRPVVFHGSNLGGLTELSTERRSRDATAYGDRTAVFASQDPVWSIFYAVLDRGEHLGSMRSGSLGIDAAPIGRRYFFSVDRGVGRHELFKDGWIYVLPDVTFDHEQRQFGLLDTAHRTSRVPVPVLATFPAHPEDFPLRAAVGRHGDGDSVLATLLRARVR